MCKATNGIIGLPNFVSHLEAAKILAQANRVCVIGCSGGGKTTLSREISTKFELEYVSIDRDIRWLPSWRAREKQQQRAITAKLVQRKRWVMDGSSPSSFDIRLPRTDLILWVRVPRRIALFGVAKRVKRYLGTVRPEMAEGCPEKLPDREFLSYIWNFEKKSAPDFYRNIGLYGRSVPIIILKTHKEMALLLKWSSSTAQPTSCCAKNP